MQRDDSLLLDMLQAAGQIREYTGGLQEPDFLKSRRDQDAVLLQFAVLGEMAKRVSLVTLILPSATICTNRIKRYCHDSGSQIRHSD